jgi:carbamoyl-phosphate synthase small subunit
MELARTLRQHEVLSFALLNIDHFKGVNDTHGHPSGDQVLRTLARILRERLRRSDIVGRLGGDEFGVIMPATEPGEAKVLLEKGTMNGMITTNEAYDLNEVLPKLKAYTTGKVVEKVTCKEKYVVNPTTELAQNGPLSGAARFDKEAYEKGVREPKPALVTELSGQGLKVALLDLGAKRNIARSLAERGCEVTVYPAGTPAQEIIDDNPDGIMLSNGPGDPKECTGVIAEIKKLYDTEIPIFAICLGHQLMALATGADTHKMKYGHRGGNHPVKDLMTGRVYISSQNHGYVVDTDKLDPSVAVPAFINVNDGTNEGLSYTGKNIFTVQFHPEACPGPQDSGYLFDRFIHMMRGEN